MHCHHVIMHTHLQQPWQRCHASTGGGHTAKCKELVPNHHPCRCSWGALCDLVDVGKCPQPSAYVCCNGRGSRTLWWLDALHVKLVQQLFDARRELLVVVAEHCGGLICSKPFCAAQHTNDSVAVGASSGNVDVPSGVALSCNL